jgi:hypothetical protein
MSTTKRVLILSGNPNPLTTMTRKRKRSPVGLANPIPEKKHVQIGQTT